MAVVSIGSLMHSGFGAHDPVFTDVSGNLLTPTVTQSEAKDSKGLVFDDAGRLGIARTFSGLGVAIYGPDLTTLLGSNNNTSSYASQGISTNYVSGHFWVNSTHSVPALSYQYDKYNFDGTRLDFQQLYAAAGFLGAISPDESIFYHTGSGGPNKVDKFDTSTHVITNLATLSTNLSQIAGAIMALRDGTLIFARQGTGVGSGIAIDHYSAAGSLISTYAVPKLGTGIASLHFTALTPGLTNATFWYAVYDDQVAGQNLVIFREMDVATFTEVNIFTKLQVDPVFEWDGAYAVVRGSIPLPTTPTPTLVNSTACCGSSTPGTPSAGAKTEVANAPFWIPSCTGGGTVPTAPAISLVERWDY